jgi:hypothetical protein
VCDLTRYDAWTPKKYIANELVAWNGKVWSAMEWEGTDANDEPGVSIHWKVFCIEGQGIVSPTPQPTEASPTPQPTEESPTPQPTEESPTPQPTEESPTPQPTEASPTPQPTEASPTPQPTEASPTPQPTEASPTPQPTEESPTPQPTEESPTPQPTDESPTPQPADESPTPIPACCVGFEHTIVTTGSMEIEQDNPHGLDTNGFEAGGTLCFHSVNVTGGQSDFMVSTDQDGIMGVVNLIGTLTDPNVVYISHSAGDCYVGNLTDQGGLNILTKV